MSGEDRISASNTYILDEDMLDEMDSIELTGLLTELSEQLSQHEEDPTLEEPSPLADEALDEADELDESDGLDEPVTNTG